MSGEQLFEIARRTFDTPESRGIGCIEVEAKLVINRVPGAFLPFDRTINPSRDAPMPAPTASRGRPTRTSI